MHKKTILVVCRGNIVRSPIACACIQKELELRNISNQYHVFSRGIQGTSFDPMPVLHPNITFYPDLYNSIKHLLQQQRIDLSSHVSTPIQETDAQSADIIISMDESISSALVSLFPRYRDKIILLSQLTGTAKNIIDPEKTTDAQSKEQIFWELYSDVHNGIDKLTELVDSKNI